MNQMNNHEKQEKTNKMRLPVSAYLLYLLVAILMFSGVSFSKFSTVVSSKDSARVAVMAMDTSYVIDQELLIAPGETKGYTVTLTNKEDDEVCEVAQNYSVTMENITKNMSLAYEYFKINGGSEEKVPAITGTFNAGVEESATYRIKVTWTGGPRPESSAFEVDALKLVIKTEQVD